VTRIPARLLADLVPRTLQKLSIEYKQVGFAFQQELKSVNVRFREEHIPGMAKEVNARARWSVVGGRWSVRYRAR